MDIIPAHEHARAETERIVGNVAPSHLTLPIPCAEFAWLGRQA
jgi:hypothetical protein